MNESFVVRLDILENPEAIVLSQVPQRSIPINNHFQIVRGKFLMTIYSLQKDFLKV